ncbi:bifunctional 4-hydroxy-2-oxoglutarate aldolase/2-dehydro-3-deoxy-phosphogluconate aldolase [Paraferrimonas sp. SM1919]|uniref:bifunctional 4-hydroxy-2-oxoglutarate aldolase/2-dehydro-3-deoxy-phosphogluconate aldolase n=1 Tax=Paraferrimonas sp. SM1919 TaxID=2662263 RepID=UPI0013D51F59|nr:bifunctional 4-hydroxy-2-oxoglutarate aldolase/2-dehydro-3-deoxy-phosphogluconate aldolase [Paraferrimonas sp. SM1919]
MSNNWKVATKDVFSRSKVVPVMVINHIDEAVPLAKALVAGGISVLEITLRTECAIEAIAKIAKEVPEALVGAGTVMNRAQLQQVIDAGAQFAISPGASVDLLKAGQDAEIALIPGVATISEVMTAVELGYTHLKFFPAEVNGGVKALKAWAGPLQGVTFCPTGGISLSNYKDYLALPSVACVGGSWIAPTDAVAAGDWDKITQLCQEALA